jgi:HK97 family phage prohead protease
MSKSRMDLQTARDWSEVNRTFARTKVVAAQIKTSPTDGSGRFVALVSTFHREPDVMGDVVSPTAFDRTIVEARAKHPQNLWPVWWGHGYDNPDNSIGVITDAYVTDEGLVVEGRLAIDSSAKALEVYRGMLEDRIREWSISYGVIREHREKIDDGRGVNVLDELELLEISSVMAGANRYTRTIEVKAASRACACSSLERCAKHRPRTKRAGTCVTCGKAQSWSVQHPVPGGTVPWAQCACGALVG